MKQIPATHPIVVETFVLCDSLRLALVCLLLLAVVFLRVFQSQGRIFKRLNLEDSSSHRMLLRDCFNVQDPLNSPKDRVLHTKDFQRCRFKVP